MDDSKTEALPNTYTKGEFVLVDTSFVDNFENKAFAKIEEIVDDEDGEKCAIVRLYSHMVLDKRKKRGTIWTITPFYPLFVDKSDNKICFSKRHKKRKRPRSRSRVADLEAQPFELVVLVSEVLEKVELDDRLTNERCVYFKGSAFAHVDW